MSQTLPNNAEVSIPVVGSDRDAWGQLLLNAVFLFDRRLGGQVGIDVTGADVTLDDTQAQVMRLWTTGTPNGDRNIYFKAGRRRAYLVHNYCTSDKVIRFRCAGDDGGVAVPRNCGVVLVSDGVTTYALSPPVLRAGGFPGVTRSADDSWWGPGIWFDTDRTMGYARREDGTLSVVVDGDLKGDSVRFHAGDNPSFPTVGVGTPDLGYGHGLVALAGFYLGLCAQNAIPMRLGAGVAVGDPTGGVPSWGWLNVENGVRFDDLPLALKRVGPVTLSDTATMTAAHGLGRVPTLIECHLECVVAQGGYSVGDIAKPHRLWGVEVGPTVWGDATNVGLRPGSGSNGWELRNKEATGSFRLTTSSWQAVWTVG